MIKIKNILFFFLSIFIGFFILNKSFASINLVITPVKYEIKGHTGTTITKIAKIRNPGNKTSHIIMGKSDFIPNGQNGVPKFVRKSEMVYPDQELANWITINTGAFDLAPGETKEISFDINIPDNATPGGHYGAIFFKNNNSESSTGTKVGINVDYGVLILLEVEGKIIVDAEIKEPKIITGGEGSPKLTKDNCPNGDFSPSYYDKTCEVKKDTNTGSNSKENSSGSVNNNNKENTNTGKLTETDNNIKEKKENFNVKFVIPIDNKGNTHIKPKGKIILKDENGNIIKGVGKEVIVNKKGAIIGQKIVDYIPINDKGGIVIPGYSRKFECEWKGFPYKNYDENGNPIIKYWTPTEYYTRKNIGNTRILMPWEQLKERNVNKKITADFRIKYKGENGEDIVFNSAKEFPISYKEKYITINWYILGPIILILILILILMLIILSKKTKCKKCGKSIKKDMKICPYCGAKQKKKKK